MPAPRPFIRREGCPTYSTVMERASSLTPTPAPLVYVLALILSAAVSCAPKSIDPSGLTPDVDLSSVEGLIEIGCYSCLREAHSKTRALFRQAPRSRRLIAAAHTASFMLAIRERELGIMSSQLTSDAEVSIAPVGVLDLLFERTDTRATTRSESEIRTAQEGLEAWLQIVPLADVARKQVRALLECPDGRASDAAVLSAKSERLPLALRYVHLRCARTFSSTEAARIIAGEPRYAEVHFERGLEAIRRGLLLTARRELLVAHRSLPQSRTVTMKLADVTLGLALFDEALRLFDEAANQTRDPDALLGRVKALSYLGRSSDALATLDELLADTGWNPGEKYYWRAWNQHQSGDFMGAETSIMLAVKAWSAPHVHTLASAIALALGDLTKARHRASTALEWGEDCEARSQLAVIDSLEQQWVAALEGSVRAARCAAQMIDDIQMGEAWSEDWQSAVAASTAEMRRLRRILASARYGAAVSAKVLGLRQTSLGCAKLVAQDPDYGHIAKDFILDIDVPSAQSRDATAGTPIVTLSCG